MTHPCSVVITFMNLCSVTLFIFLKSELSFKYTKIPLHQRPRRSELNTEYLVFTTLAISVRKQTNQTRLSRYDAGSSGFLEGLASYAEGFGLLEGIGVISGGV